MNRICVCLVGDGDFGVLSDIEDVLVEGLERLHDTHIECFSQ